MRRLSIIDLAGGDQPLFNEDGTVSLVFNGEIYNYRELRRQLEDAGSPFSTATDGEVIVHLWEEHGEQFAKHLNGMFAIALHDALSNAWSWSATASASSRCSTRRPMDIWSSDPRSRRCWPRVWWSHELDLDALWPVPGLGVRPGAGDTVRGSPASSSRVPAGASSTKPAKFIMSQWWQIPSTAGTKAGLSAEDWLDAVDEQIHESVRRQLVSDVPLGAFLSGGVDSSLVVAHMGAARTFSIGFDDPSYDELPGPQESPIISASRTESRSSEPQIAELFEEPDALHGRSRSATSPSSRPTWSRSWPGKRSRSSLTGDGGDELFGGYETYVAQQMARSWQSVPRLLRSGLLEPWIRRSSTATARRRG